YEEVIMGGPMMGMSIASLEVPVTKGTSGVLVFRERRFIEEQGERGTRFPCIKCGRCVDACPMRLNPAQMVWLAEKREYTAMQEKFNLNSCFECGCCSFVCPSNIPLVQYFRIAKSINNENREATA
ncbi:electron transporter RnfC, partial [Solemya velum gill symbiont]